MKRFIVLAALLLAHGRLAWGQERVLPREAEKRFTVFMQRVQQGALGPGIVNANITVEKSEARLRLVLKDGTHHLFRLLPSDGTGVTPSHQFTVIPEKAESIAELRSLGALLDQCFPSDPFTLATEERPVTFEGTGVLERSLRPVRPRRLAIVLLVQLIACLVCLLALLRENGPGAGLSTDTR